MLPKAATVATLVSDSCEATMFILNRPKPKIPFPLSRPLMESLERRVLLSSSQTIQLSLLVKGALDTSGSPDGLSPAMIEEAYNLDNLVFTTGGKTVAANGAGETIAIVDAYADPNIVSDLKTFDANFGLTNDNASGQFVLTVDTPEGAAPTDAGWATEESLDVEWAHAIAPEADIMLVEAPSDAVADLTQAVTWAAAQTGVVAVSMSWGDSPEFAGETAYDSDFTTPSGHEGVTFVAASGDDGLTNYPSTSPNVLAVGGTSLIVDSSGDWQSESAWSGSGGGVSPYEGTDKPDVAYDADPDTGFLIYDSLPSDGESGWQVVGGTSAGTPQWAAIIALADQGRALRDLGSLDGPSQTISDLYALPSSDFNDVTGDGFTGLGSPIGEKIISALVGGGITSVGFSSSPSPAAAQLAFVQQPSDSTAGSAINPSLVVDVEDSDGDIVTTDNSTVTISV
ncbi:MAG: S53 family peptidase, partial [Tepidisphaeraceae bacterium]